MIQVIKQKSRHLFYTRQRCYQSKKNFAMNIPDFYNKVIDVFAESKEKILDFT